MSLPRGTGSDVSLHDLLEGRRAERDALLQRAHRMAEADPRVAAAWLFGSCGRGDPDALSDLDLFLVVGDAHLDAVAGERRAYVTRVGEPILLLEAPQNAPPGGAYLMALYEGEAGPHQIDWYWQALSMARLPEQTRLLFDRAHLPRADGPPRFESRPVPERTPEEAVVQAINSFWVMLLITAKYAARSPNEERMGLLPYVTGPLHQVERFLTPDLPTLDDAGAPHARPNEKLRVLRDLTGRMNELTPRVAAHGVDVPSGIVPHIQRYLALIERIIAPR